MYRATRAALAIVAVHLVVHAAHGLVHEAIPVRIAGWQTAYVAVAVFVLPVLAAGLFLRDRPRAGGVALLVAGVASLAFELAYHFVVENPDHVGAVETGAVAFSATAVLAVGADVLLIAAGAWVLLGRHRRDDALTGTDGRRPT